MISLEIQKIYFVQFINPEHGELLNYEEELHEKEKEIVAKNGTYIVTKIQDLNYIDENDNLLTLKCVQFESLDENIKFEVSRINNHPYDPFCLIVDFSFYDDYSKMKGPKSFIDEYDFLVKSNENEQEYPFFIYDHSSFGDFPAVISPISDILNQLFNENITREICKFL